MNDPGCWPRSARPGFPWRRPAGTFWSTSRGTCRNRGRCRCAATRSGWTGGFWSALLGVAVVEVGEDYTELARLSEGGPNLLFLQVPEAKAGKNRLHLDVVVSDVKSAVDSAVDLGARPAEGELAGPFPWTV